MSFGVNRGQQQSTSFGRSESESTSTSSSLGVSSSSQSIAFEDVFRRMFGGASNAAATALAGAPELSRIASQLFTGGMQFFENLGGDPGTQFLRERISGESPVLDEQIAALEEDVGRLFREQINPAITSRAVAGGTLGGGRQGVAQALGAEAAAREFTRGATQLRAADMAARDSAAAQVAQQSLMAASTGLGALPGLLDIAERGNTAELGVYSALSSILGSPTTLTRSDSFSTSLAEAFARSFSEQRGSSSGRSVGVNIGFPWE